MSSKTTVNDAQSGERRVRVVPKESVVKTWSPFAVVPFWNIAQGDDDTVYSEKLPDFTDCRVVRHFDTAVLEHGGDHDERGYRRFLDKLYRDRSFEALAVLTTFEIALGCKGEWKTRLEDIGLENISSDDDMSLLLESWPVIQEHIPWKAYNELYCRVHSNLHMIPLPNPLTSYAKQTVLYLCQRDFEKAIEGAVHQKWILQPTSNRLQASQLFLDYVASLPPRMVGVLLEDPVSTFPSKTNILQSCLPSTCLELSVSDDDECLTASLISLYSLYADEAYTVSTRPSPEPCSCSSCRYNGGPSVFLKSVGGHISLVQRLAHSLFQQEQFDAAKKLYLWCHERSSDISQKADLWHAMGAVELTRLQFVEAQRHWEQGKHCVGTHAGMTLQIEKQTAYAYLDPLPTLSQNPIVPAYKTLSPRLLFTTPNMVSSASCQQLIQWAEDAAASDGWTESRHYAVPTTDVPVHQIPQALEWFQNWMNREVRALFQEQFQTQQRFYVHDAFLVRYTASSKSRFLPLHFDESTHSMVLALNDDFEGGGTYIYNLDQTIAPKTGTLVSFRGNKVLHGGNVVTRGLRYILAVFLYLDDDSCHDKSSRAEDALSGSSTKRRKTERTSEGFSFGFF